MFEVSIIELLDKRGKVCPETRFYVPIDPSLRRHESIVKTKDAAIFVAIGSY
ncbi:MAG: hypothetical protein IPM25_07915 [Chloracidobacterium sp.]|nr:hypothetical protein [Chloracidobacterium sp.]